jgi:hypothetical protein
MGDLQELGQGNSSKKVRNHVKKSKEDHYSYLKKAMALVMNDHGENTILSNSLPIYPVIHL